MQRLCHFMSETPFDTFETWERFVRFKHVINDKEKKNDRLSDEEKGRNSLLSAAFLFLAGMKEITKDRILEIDPTQEFMSLVTELFEKIVSHWKNIPAEYLLPVIMNLIPKLDDASLDLLVKKLDCMYNIILRQEGANEHAYCTLTIVSAIRAKKNNIPWRDEKSSAKEKESEERVASIAKKLLAEQELLEDLSSKESKKSSTVISESKERDGYGLFAYSAMREMKQDIIILKKCDSIYKKYIDDKDFLDFTTEVCAGYKPQLEIAIQQAILKKTPLYKKYFKGRSIDMACIDIAHDAENRRTEIAAFVKQNPVLYKDINNYRLTCAVLNSAKELNSMTRPDNPIRAQVRLSRR
jgi:hypothetical protein